MLKSMAKTVLNILKKTKKHPDLSDETPISTIAKLLLKWK